MAYCSKCGQEIPEGMRYCTACGADSGVNGTDGGARRDGSANFEQILDAEDYTASFDPSDIRDNKIYAVLAYLGILVLIPLLAARKSPFARFHTEQGFLLFILGAAKEIVFKILYTILRGTMFGVGAAAVHTLSWVASILLFIWAVIGIVNAVQGKAKELPLIGKWKLFHL